MKNSFQTIILIIFSAMFVIAVAVFSGIFSSKSKTDPNKLSGTVEIWGTFPEEVMLQYVASFNARGGDYNIDYFEHDPDEITQDLTVALANDTPPDTVLLTSEIFSQFKDKLFLIPYTVFSERAYRDTNVDGAQIFLSKDGIVAVPLLVDPIVVYYNKDILAAATYALPPRTWTDVIDATRVLTKRNAAGSITQSTIALGEVTNVAHFKDILSSLFIQAGNPIVAYDAGFDRGQATLDAGDSTVSAVDFYTGFANPTNEVYSWNRALPESLDMFISGRSAFYIGRASELFTIQAQNPNLNFDVMELFQPEDSSRPLTYGSFIGMGIMKAAPNFNAAYAFVASLSGDQQIADEFSKFFSLPPARRDLILTQQSNPYISVFFRAALSAFAWPDPNPVISEGIFRDMIQDVISGRSNTSSAINEANRNLQSNIR